MTDNKRAIFLNSQVIDHKWFYAWYDSEGKLSIGYLTDYPPIFGIEPTEKLHTFFSDLAAQSWAGDNDGHDEATRNHPLAGIADALGTYYDDMHDDPEGYGADGQYFNQEAQVYCNRTNAKFTDDMVFGDKNPWNREITWADLEHWMHNGFIKLYVPSQIHDRLTKSGFDLLELEKMDFYEDMGIDDEFEDDFIAPYRTAMQALVEIEQLPEVLPLSQRIEHAIKDKQSVLEAFNDVPYQTRIQTQIDELEAWLAEVRKDDKSAD
jgi:hypothetical protein